LKQAGGSLSKFIDFSGDHEEKRTQGKKRKAHKSGMYFFSMSWGRREFLFFAKYQEHVLRVYKLGNT